ncbi:MAG: ATP-grasp domain-containing protein [Gammaproteobacteria bacterium]|nr:ATP-grasp domain-containing protein [Gammaproteobacteria bacterium]
MSQFDTDQLFQIAEKLSQDFSLFPNKEDSHAKAVVKGLLSQQQVEDKSTELKQLGIDAYIKEVVSPSESSQRLNARQLVHKLTHRFIKEEEYGPLYIAEVELDFNNQFRRVGFIGQNRAERNGAWLPEHHNQAATALREFAKHLIPVVTLIDTPGADASEQANLDNQAHSISRLIAEMSNIDIPTVGIILGAGYSGGAIPLASTNILLSVRDGIFNTIQPQGLASIARKYNLSWQECAKYVGVSAYELQLRNVIDGIIDYAPGDRIDQLQNLSAAITSSIESIEKGAENFARENPYLMDHYLRSVERYLNPSDKLVALEKGSTLNLASSPSEHHNLFRMTYRYMRYLTLRKRISSTTTGHYSRLAEVEVPTGKLNERLEEEKRRKFQKWLHTPDKIRYDEDLNKLWKNYTQKLEERSDSRGSISKLFFGEPEDNYIKAKQDFCFSLGLYLFNRWKSDADVNFAELIHYLENYQQSRFLLTQDDLLDSQAIIDFIKNNEHALAGYIQKSLNYETQALLAKHTKGKISPELTSGLTEALNSIIKENKIPKDVADSINLSQVTQQLLNSVASGALEANRRVLEDALAPYIRIKSDESSSIKTNKDVSVLDAILLDDLRTEFISISQNLIMFGTLYDYVIRNLVTIAKEAKETHSLSYLAVTKLLNNGLDYTNKLKIAENHKEEFANWFKYFVASSQRGDFLKQVEEWKKHSFPRLSDTLFVIVTFFFDKLLAEFYESESGSNYNGRINPYSIGRKKDFWNRLTIAYFDLLIQDVLDDVKKQRTTHTQAFIDRFFNDFEEINDHLMTADPVQFPGFRSAIEKALSSNVTPCGVITGFGTIKIGEESRRVGTLISNLDFQAGAFDMASAEKFCKLLVECARHNYPVVCFVSSGGMQTKEGASALFSMSVVNDRITRFVRDNDLPIVIFGYGDCTGGAQASFVTHPMVQTFYFSGTNMPFAGQIVVPSYLPSTSTLSNYLSLNSQSMADLVKHPFVEDLDSQLRAIDPAIPVARKTVDEVLARILKGFVTPGKATAKEVTNQNKEKLFRPVKKVLVHARGCTAEKLVRKAQENDIDVVLVQSDPDMNSTAADNLNSKGRLVCIGGNTPDESYLNAQSVIRIAELEQVDSLHPGIGFLSESAQFAAFCGNHDINFIGPSVSSMETMGNKSNAINTAISSGVPVVPGSHGIVTTSAMAAKVADEIGYPVLLKAVHGGGGKGIQVVHDPADIHELFHQISTEARSAFGSGDVYLEKFVTSLRHIEVQILRDSQGNTKVLGLRDCSVQRNNQKIIEESGSTMLPSNLEEKVYDYAAKLADAVDYYGAGTVEFIYNLDANDVYFMEMNTRLQVEHPVTELVTDIDIMGQQFKIASGQSIADIKVKQKGYAMELRINAEKATIQGEDIQFIPNAGKITRFELPEDKNIQILKSIDSGKEVTPFYDSMVVQVICYGKDRNDTIKKLLNYLDNVVIQGVSTNIPLLKRILNDDVFVNGDYDTNYLPNFLNRIDQQKLIEDIATSAGDDKQSMTLDNLRIEGSNELKVLAPASSIFYSAPSPTEPPYVKEGDTISVTKTLCLMEAMKMFSPLTLKSFNSQGNTLYDPDAQYKIVRIHNAEGQQVNQGDLLFVISPVQH